MEEMLLSNELNMLRKTVRAFTREFVVPTEKAAGSTIEQLSMAVVKELQKKAKERGLWLFGTQSEWGGAGLSYFEQVVILEEVVQHRLGLQHPGAGAFGEDLPNFLSGCSAEQFEKYVKPAIKTGNGCYIALWEPEESNHLDNLTCYAEKKDGKWIIQGKKSCVTHVDRADFGVLLVQCLTENREGKPTLFLLDRDDLIGKREQVLLDVQTSHVLSFEKLELEDTRRIGELGEGIKLLNEWLAISQVLMSARYLGIAKMALKIGIDYASLRITRGKPLSGYPTIRTMMAVSEAELQAARLTVWNAALKMDQKKRDRDHVAQIAKLIASETAAKVVDRVLQIHGGAGFTRDVPLERWYKELRINRLHFQSSETLHESIAAYLLEK